MLWDPDSEDITGNTPQGYMAGRYSKSASAWESASLEAQGSPVKYLSYGVADAVKDHGTIQFISRGSTATFDLYVHYDVSLIDANSISATNQIASNSIGAGSFFTDGVLQSLGPSYASGAGTGVFRLGVGFYDVFVTLRGVGLTGGFTTTMLNATSKLYTASTTHAVFRCVGSSDGASVVSYTGSNTSLAAYSVSITALSRSAYDALVNNFA